MSKASLDKLAQQAAAVYRVEPSSVRKQFLEMHVFTSEQYLHEKFRIYCKPQFEGA